MNKHFIEQTKNNVINSNRLLQQQRLKTSRAHEIVAHRLLRK